MPRGGSRPGAGRKPDPNSKRQKALTAKAAAKKAPAVKKPGRSMSELKEQGAPEAAKWPFGTKPPETPKEPEQPADKLPAGSPEQTPLEFLLGVMRNPEASVSARLTAAIQAAPYVHPKLSPKAKKEGGPVAEEPAAKTDKYAVRQPPRLAAAGGKKV